MEEAAASGEAERSRSSAMVAISWALSGEEGPPPPPMCPPEKDPPPRTRGWAPATTAPRTATWSRRWREVPCVVNTQVSKRHQTLTQSPDPHPTLTQTLTTSMTPILVASGEEDKVRILGGGRKRRRADASTASAHLRRHKGG